MEGHGGVPRRQHLPTKLPVSLSSLNPLRGLRIAFRSKSRIIAAFLVSLYAVDLSPFPLLGVRRETVQNVLFVCSPFFPAPPRRVQRIQIAVLMKGSRVLAFPSSQCTCIKQRSCAPYLSNCFSPLHILSFHPLSDHNLDLTSVKIMPSPPETKVPASTVDENSAKYPSDTGCVFGDESDQSAGTGGLLFRDFDFESYDGTPVEEFPWTYHQCVLRETVGADEETRPGETAAGEAPVWDNRSEWGGGEQEVKTGLPSAVSISDYCVTHTARTEHTRNSNSRTVRGRHEQSGGTGGRVGMTNAKTRSQTAEERNGTSITGGSTAVGGIKNDGQKVIKKEKL